MSLYTRKIVRARKAHECYICGKDILPGSRYVRHAGISDFGDGFYTSADHLGCNDLYSLLNRIDSDRYPYDACENWTDGWLMEAAWDVMDHGIGIVESVLEEAV